MNWIANLRRSDSSELVGGGLEVEGKISIWMLTNRWKPSHGLLTQRTDVGPEKENLTRFTMYCQETIARDNMWVSLNRLTTNRSSVATWEMVGCCPSCFEMLLNDVNATVASSNCVMTWLGTICDVAALLLCTINIRRHSLTIFQKIPIRISQCWLVSLRQQTWEAFSLSAPTHLDILFILTLHSDNGHKGYHYDIGQSYCSRG